MSLAKCPYCAEEIQEEAMKCKHCGSWLTGDPAHGPSAPEGLVETGFSPARLERSASDKMIAGICGGAARYVGIDSTIVRIVVAITTVMTGIVPGILIYFILSFVIPREDVAFLP